MLLAFVFFFFFFFNDTATTEIYTLSLHDALPIYIVASRLADQHGLAGFLGHAAQGAAAGAGADVGVQVDGQLLHADRKSTRLNSSHSQISYAVFCLKKKNKQGNQDAMSDRRQGTH